jgi:predicted  nucleic acid-binding Zn-ribbon protein
MSDLHTDNNIAPLMAEIHQIQRQLSDLHSRLYRGPKMIQVQKDAAERIHVRLEQVKAEHRQLVQAAKFKEEQLAQSEAALNRRKSQMQEAKTNKEFQALKLQVEIDETANETLADEALCAMEKVEKFAPNIISMEQELQAANEMLAKTQAKITEELPTIEADVVRCTARLKEAEHNLPRDFRDIYLRLAKSMGGEQSMAQIYDQNFCGGCRQSIPINFIAQVLHSKPVTCKSCGRLLYIPEGFSMK